MDKTTVLITPDVRNEAFTREVSGMHGCEDLWECIQCGVCSGSCPARFAMDYSPMQVIKMVQLGLKEKALSTDTYWLCASCHACATRCPRGIDLPHLMLNLKNIALKEGVPSRIKAKPKFHRSFAEIVQKYGRIHEAELYTKILDKTNIKALVDTMFFGYRLSRKGKVNLKPPRVGQVDQLLSAYKKSLEVKKG